MVRTLEQYKNQTSFLLAGCQCRETIGWSVVKTFMRVLPNGGPYSRGASELQYETEAPIWHPLQHDSSLIPRQKCS